MPTYRVHLTQTVSTVVEIDADSIGEAIDRATDEAPPPTNITNHGIDACDVWEPVEVTDEDHRVVWTESAGAAVPEVTE